MGRGTAMGEKETRRMVDALRDVIDPELGINIVDLGLVYEVEVGDGSARIVMTVTSPICPMKPYLVEMARREVRSSVEDVSSLVSSFRVAASPRIGGAKAESPSDMRQVI
jgi:metal-sulfur cluster biosynthetic enzyme